MNSDDIQKALYWHLIKKSHTYMCPNKHLDNWFECDMLSVTKSDFLHEYEIKISKADFKADFDKVAKHLILNGKDTIKLGINDPTNAKMRQGDYRSRKLIVEGDVKSWNYDFSKLMKPNYFWYVTPVGLLEASDIPDYAGWMEVRDTGGFYHTNIKKQAKRLHKDKVDDKCKLRILESLFHRYWQLKLK